MFTAAIANTASRGGRTRRRLRDIRQRLDSVFDRPDSPLRWYFTERRRHATLLARQALRDGAGMVVSVGGDGTHNEVAQGFFSETGERIRPDAVLATVSSGSGGDLRRSLGMGRSVRENIEALCHARACPLDTGRVEYTDGGGIVRRTYFLNVVSAGMSGVVDSLVARSRLKGLSGSLSFACATAGAFLKYRNVAMTVVVDGKRCGKSRMCTVAAATGRYFGGGMKIAPGAIVDDGEFDVVCLGDFHLHDFIFRGHRLYGGTHYSLKKVCHCRGKNVRIESGADVLLDVDGETPGRLPVEITVLPRSLRVLTGPHACVSGDVT